jgi:hypothetical protein
MTDLTIADVLNRAADLLEKPGAWTQGWFARDAIGNKTPVDSRSATCFCVMGALQRAANATHSDDVIIAAREILIANGARAKGPLGRIANWNDAPERTQAEVVAKLREAARLSTPPRVGEG